MSVESTIPPTGPVSRVAGTAGASVATPAVLDRGGTASGAVFLSYAREDAVAARRLADALRAGGLGVWFDENELRGGDVWDQKIRRQIDGCALFMPIVSRHIQERGKGYFRLEWRLAVEQTHLLAEGIPFVAPVAIDDTRESEAIVPAEFVRVQWMRLRDALPTPDFVAQVRQLITPARGAGAHAPTPHGSARSTPSAGPISAAIEKSIAVLPFANMSADAENEYFSDGITEEIINALVQVPGLRVAARTSVFAFKGKAEDLRAVAARLNVRTVLEGSVRKAGNRIRITAQLINAADGYHLWSEKFDRALDDIFAVQDEIARTITEKLKMRLVGEESRPLVTAPTADLEAYQLYLQGRYFWGQRGAGLAKGLQCFESALARDPSYALAHAGAADAYTLLGFYGYAPPNDVMPKARAAAQRALALDPELAEAHCALGFILLSYDRDVVLAERELRRSIELKPAYVPARYWLASVLISTGRNDEGVAVDEEAVRIEPFSLFANAHLGWTLLLVNRPHDAMQRLRHVAELEPRLGLGRWLLGQSLLTLGQADEGVAELHLAVELSGRMPWISATLASGLARVGRLDEAREILADLLRRAEKEYVKPFAIALLHAYLREPDAAYAWLERAREDHDAALPYMGAIEHLDVFSGITIPARLAGPERLAAFIQTLRIKRS